MLKYKSQFYNSSTSDFVEISSFRTERNEIIISDRSGEINNPLGYTLVRYAAPGGIFAKKCRSKRAGSALINAFRQGVLLRKSSERSRLSRDEFLKDSFVRARVALNDNAHGFAAQRAVDLLQFSSFPMPGNPVFYLVVKKGEYRNEFYIGHGAAELSGDTKLSLEDLDALCGMLEMLVAPGEKELDAEDFLTLLWSLKGDGNLMLTKFVKGVIASAGVIRLPQLTLNQADMLQEEFQPYFDEGEEYCGLESALKHARLSAALMPPANKARVVI